MFYTAMEKKSLCKVKKNNQLEITSSLSTNSRLSLNSKFQDIFNSIFCSKNKKKKETVCYRYVSAILTISFFELLSLDSNWFQEVTECSPKTNEISNEVMGTNTLK